MIASKLKKVSKDGYTWDLWQVLDFGSVGLVKVADEKEDSCYDGYSYCLDCHGELLHTRKT